jgi:hypothetical protein
MSWVVKPTSTAMMLLATRRKVVRVSARLWPRKSCERGVSFGWFCASECRSGAYDLAFVDVAGLVEEGVHCGLSGFVWVCCSGWLRRLKDRRKREPKLTLCYMSFVVREHYMLSLPLPIQLLLGGIRLDQGIGSAKHVQRPDRSVP